jgi:hypothetical protein
MPPVTVFARPPVRLLTCTIMLATALVIPACRNDEPLTPDRGEAAIARVEVPESYSVPSGARLPESLVRAHLVELARLTALALADDSLRARVYRDLRGSPYREGKLEFSSYTEGRGARLLAAMAVRSGPGTSRQALGRLRDSTVALELYLPVADHRMKWMGDANLLVATSLLDRDPPVAFDLQGHRVVLPSSKAPPATPTLALVPVETDFGVVPQQICNPAVTPSCGGGGGGGTPPPVTHGIYLTKVHLNDTGEGFLRGSPEIEAMLMGPLMDTLSVAKIDCANESRTGTPRFYNQDDNDWSGNVLLADSAQLANILALYPPGTPWTKVRFSFAFWEDDTGRCQIATTANTWKNDMILSGLALAGGAAATSIDWSNPDDIKSGGPFVAAGLIALYSLIRTIGGSDDYLGLVVNPNAWNPVNPNDPVTSQAVIIGKSRNGTATLIWR